MKRLIGLIAAVTSTLISTHALASHANLVDIDVIDRDTGRAMPLFDSRGKSFVAGEPGHRYSINLTNRSGERVLAVLSVDGVNAVSGQSANPQQSGYVLAPYQTTEVSGWRKSHSEIAQFVFTAPWDSYASRTGRPQNVGVIGVAVFREARPIWYPNEAEISRRESPRYDGNGRYKQQAPVQQAPAPSAGAADASSMAKRGDYERGGYDQHSELGTGHGEREWSQVRTTEFRRASTQPDAIVEVQYDTFEHLVERGVIPRRSRLYERERYQQEPRAFAGYFVPDP
jgi:hypothetical protein